MPVGFLLMIVGAVQSETTSQLLQQAVKMPAILFFAIAAAGLILMVVCAKKLDQKDAHGNWIEEIINCISQTLVLIGVILL